MAPKYPPSEVDSVVEPEKSWKSSLVRLTVMLTGTNRPAEVMPTHVSDEELDLYSGRTRSSVCVPAWYGSGGEELSQVVRRSASPDPIVFEYEHETMAKTERRRLALRRAEKNP